MAKCTNNHNDNEKEGDSKADDEDQDYFILIHLYHRGRYIRKGGGATSGLIGTDTEVPFLLRNILGHQMRMKLLIDNNGDENNDETSMIREDVQKSSFL